MFNPKTIILLLLKTKTMSELALKLIREAKEKRLTRLDLGPDKKSGWIDRTA